MQSPFSGGLLIVFDGIDGVGKTTQSALTAQLFGERGIRCAYSKEPTSGPWGTKLRESAKAGRLSPEDELDYFLKDRQEHVQNTIRPTLDAGGVVVLDRYYFSTAAYQGIRGFDFWEIIERNEAFAPRPDLFSCSISSLRAAWTGSVNGATHPTLSKTKMPSPKRVRCFSRRRAWSAARSWTLPGR